ncbi:hypothetical protein RGQ29_009882 [Quercus rubra]|uniref:BRISC and BRCA1-A complex member 2 n=1 Tax=Quercus rubra TaxID=3512 RepID=A0AAN7G1P9_QUERU|nr:hypothetical protein RGQ29_009882 [Quercus rubra]
MASDGVPPIIAAQLNYLLSHFPLSVKIEHLWSGSKFSTGVIDRFTIVIPYCLDFIKWDFIYNSESPISAPDVIFGAEDENFLSFLARNDGVEGNANSAKNCLSDWNGKDPTRLMVLLQQLRDQYMNYQRKRVDEVDDDRLKFEVSTIAFREPEEVKFAVPLTEMNIDKMVHGCPWRHSPKIYLQVIYPVGRKYVSASSAPRLKLLSTSDLKSIFSIEDFKLPPWLDGMCMAEYLPHLEESLEKQILEAVSLIDVRRRFIESLAPLFGRPLEADPIFCRKATFLAGSGAFTFLVHFSISTQFPKQQPGLMLQSSQHMNSHGVPAKSPLITEYPWSPRWETSVMAEKIFEFLVDEALNFKRYCNEAQLQH